MADNLSALADVTAAVDGVVAELQKLSDEVAQLQGGENIADQLEGLATRLNDATNAAENPPAPPAP